MYILNADTDTIVRSTDDLHSPSVTRPVLMPAHAFRVPTTGADAYWVM